ncbi:SH3 and PX domain-containing protein 2A-like isoform X2 [Lineus longissimus]|uniref:SH3 and PX domain-containing protein 2A-like isoform X2 n=1 Tax=Lineus longissimus TaxID=88925 RepID=UPI002B4F268B
MVIRIVSGVRVIDIEKRRHPSKHYVFVISITWSDGTVTVIYRRYSKFFELQSKLLDKFEVESGTVNPEDRIIPFLPGKILIGRSHIEKVARKRLHPIDEYCKALITLPQMISESDEVLQFFESSREDINPQLGISEKKKEQTADSISEPMLLEQYIAIADYKKEAAKEVNLREGQMVEVIEKNEMGWWLVSVEDSQGWVPSSYLERSDGIEEDTMIETLTDDDYKYICLDDFIPDNQDEIQLDKGGMVDVVQKSLDGWWLVRFKGKEGWAPAAYLTQITAERAAFITSQGSRNPDVECLKRNDVPSGTRKSSSFESNLKFPRPSLELVSNILKKITPSPSPEPSRKSSIDTEQPTGGVEIITNMMEVSNLPIKKLKDHQGSSPTGSTSSKKNSPFRIPSGGERSSPGSGKAPPRRGSISRSKVAPKRPEPPKFRKEYYTVADFADGADDGINFSVGEKVEIIERNTSGWWFVKIRDQEGWAPSSYIEEKQVPLVLPSSPVTTVRQGVHTEPTAVKPSPSAPPAPSVGGLKQTINAAIKRVPSDSEEDENDFDDDFDEDNNETLVPPKKNGFNDFTNEADEVSKLPQELYIAVAAYEKVEDTEISFNEDDVVEVIEKTEDGWWLIKIGDDEGWAPESYLVEYEEVEDDFADDPTGSDSPIIEPPEKEEAVKSSLVQSHKDESKHTPPVMYKAGPRPVSPKSQNDMPVSTTPTPSQVKPFSEIPTYSFPVKQQNTSKPFNTALKPVSKPSVEAKPSFQSKPSIEPKPKFNKPVLPSKPDIQKPQPSEQKESRTKSKVSSMSSMFDSGNVDENNPASQAASAKRNAAKSPPQVYSFLTGPKLLPKPKAQKSPGTSSVSNSSRVGPKPVMPKSKPTLLSVRPKPEVKTKQKPTGLKDTGNAEGELGAVLSRRKVKVDNENVGEPRGSDPASNRNRGIGTASTASTNSSASNGTGSVGQQKATSVKELQRVYNQIRPR